MFHCIRNCQTFLQSNCTTLHSHQQCMRIPFTSHPCQYLIFSVFKLFWFLCLSLSLTPPLIFLSFSVSFFNINFLKYVWMLAFSLFKMFIYLFLRERTCKQGRKIEGDRESEAGSELSVQSPKWGLNSGAWAEVSWSWPELKSHA